MVATDMAPHRQSAEYSAYPWLAEQEALASTETGTGRQKSKHRSSALEWPFLCLECGKNYVLLSPLNQTSRTAT